MSAGLLADLTNFLSKSPSLLGLGLVGELATLSFLTYRFSRRRADNKDASVRMTGAVSA
jgi:hypothetical protein